MLCLLLATPLSLSFATRVDSTIPLIFIPYSTFVNYGMAWYQNPIFGNYGIWYGYFLFRRA